MVQTLPLKREIKLRIPPPGVDEESQRAWFEDALALSPERLHEALRRLITAEDSLEGDERRRAIIGRLRAWIALGPRAHHLVRAYERAMRSLPRSVQTWRLVAERDAALNGLTFAEFRALSGLVPWMREARAEMPGWPGDEDRVLALGAALAAM